jgi:transcriptional regulator with XRE-family HTH domain
LTQVEVAQLLDQPQSYVSRCESGERRVDVVDLSDFAVIYNQPLSYPIEERVIEIYRDLAAYYKKIEIKILETSASPNYKIGKLTEYFKFDEVEPVLRDLRQMKPKVLEKVELDILDGNLSFPLPHPAGLSLIPQERRFTQEAEIFP